MSLFNRTTVKVIARPQSATEVSKAHVGQEKVSYSATKTSCRPKTAPLGGSPGHHKTFAWTTDAEEVSDLIPYSRRGRSPMRRPLSANEVLEQYTRRSLVGPSSETKSTLKDGTFNLSHTWTSPYRTSLVESTLSQRRSRSNTQRRNRTEFDPHRSKSPIYRSTVRSSLSKRSLSADQAHKVTPPVKQKLGAQNQQPSTSPSKSISKSTKPDNNKGRHKEKCKRSKKKRDTKHDTDTKLRAKCPSKENASSRRGSVSSQSSRRSASSYGSQNTANSRNTICSYGSVVAADVYSTKHSVVGSAVNGEDDISDSNSVTSMESCSTTDSESTNIVTTKSKPDGEVKENGSVKRLEINLGLGTIAEESEEEVSENDNEAPNETGENANAIPSMQANEAGDEETAATSIQPNYSISSKPGADHDIFINPGALTEANLDSHHYQDKQTQPKNTVHNSEPSSDSQEAVYVHDVQHSPPRQRLSFLSLVLRSRPRDQANTGIPSLPGKPHQVAPHPAGSLLFHSGHQVKTVKKPTKFQNFMPEQNFLSTPSVSLNDKPKRMVHKITVVKKQKTAKRQQVMGKHLEVGIKSQEVMGQRRLSATTLLSQVQDDDEIQDGYNGSPAILPIAVVNYLRYIKEYPNIYEQLNATATSPVGALKQTLLTIGKVSKSSQIQQSKRSENAVVEAAYNLGASPFSPQALSAASSNREEGAVSMIELLKRPLHMRGQATVVDRSFEKRQRRKNEEEELFAKNKSTTERLKDLQDLRTEAEKYLSGLATADVIRAREMSLRALGEEDSSIRRWWLAQKFCKYLRKDDPT